MYQGSIPRFVHMLGNHATILDKAQAYTERKKIDAKVLPASRLFPDMLPLTSQVCIACDTVKRAAAMLAGVDNPVYEDDETTIPELKARVEKTIAFLNSIKPAQIDGTEGKEIVVKVGGQDTPFKGMQFLLARATARQPARGHPGVGARPKVGQQASGAARCHRKWTLDSTGQRLLIQVCAVESPIRPISSRNCSKADPCWCCWRGFWRSGCVRPSFANTDVCFRGLTLPYAWCRIECTMPVYATGNRALGFDGFVIFNLTGRPVVISIEIAMAVPQG